VHKKFMKVEVTSVSWRKVNRRVLLKETYSLVLNCPCCRVTHVYTNCLFSQEQLSVRLRFLSFSCPVYIQSPQLCAAFSCFTFSTPAVLCLISCTAFHVPHSQRLPRGSGFLGSSSPSILPP